MPRFTHSLPKYRKHRASGQAIVTFGGRDFYLGPYGSRSSRIEYDRLTEEFLASGRSLTFGQPEPTVSIVQLAADYLMHAKAYYGTGKNSEFHRIKPILRPLVKLYGKTPAADFGPLQLKAVRATLIDADQARTTINHSMQRLVRMFKWAVGEGRLHPNVPSALTMVPGLRRGRTAAREPDPVLPVADDVISQTLVHLPSVVADMVRLQRLSGARPDEICSMRPMDVSRDHDVWVYRPGSHKTEYLGKERRIMIGPKGQAILTEYLSGGMDKPCFSPTASMAEYYAKRTARRKTPLSCGNRPGSNRKSKKQKTAGECYTTDSYRRAIHNACDKAFPHPELGGLRKSLLTLAQGEALKQWRSEHRWSPNQLRHSAATQIRREFGLEAAQVVLGHAEASVTQIYAERDFAKAVAVAIKIG